MGFALLRREISPLRSDRRNDGGGAAFWSVDPPENDWMLLIDILILSGGPADMGAKALEFIKMLSREISCHHGARPASA